MYVSLLPVVEACVVVAVSGRVGEVRVAADEPKGEGMDTGSGRLGAGGAFMSASTPYKRDDQY